MVPLLLMPALLFEVRFADSNVRSVFLYCSNIVFTAVFLAVP